MSIHDARSEAKTWLRYAEEDLRAAKWALQGEDVAPRHACFLCQQAAEKAVKSLLIMAGVDFPKVHDIEALCRLLPEHLARPISLTDPSSLTQWAVESRYPTDSLEATREDASGALAQAEVLVGLAAVALGTPEDGNTG
jgi:HEPN domain-containing protein